MKPTLYEMAAAVAIKIQQIDRRQESSLKISIKAWRYKNGEII